MNILLVTEEDPFFIPIFLKEFFNNIDKKEFSIIGVIIQETLGKKSLYQVVKLMYDFYGPKDFVIVGFKYITYKILGFIAVKIFKGNFPGCFSIKHYLHKNKVNIFDIRNINSDESLRFLKNLNIDVILSIAASQIFKKQVLETPKYGCFNVHTAKLPKNRGFLPTFWSLYNYDIDPISAVTVHKMNERLDDGEILLQEEFELNPKETLEQMIIRTKKLGANVTIKALKLLKSGNYVLRENDINFATYNKFPTKEDVKKFKEKGLKLR